MVTRRLAPPYESIARRIYQLLNSESLVGWEDQPETMREWYRQQVSEAIQ